MSNFPDLSYDAISLLIYVEAHRLFGHGPRLDNTPARRELKKHKLAYSEPPNKNVLLPAVAGHGHCWYLTQFGAKLAKTFRKEREEAGIDVPTYSWPGAWMIAERAKASA